MVIPQPVIPPLTENAGKIAALTMLAQSPGWALVKQVLQDNMDYLGKMLIKRRDPETGEALDEKELEDASRRYDLLEELMKTPEGYIGALERAEANKPVDFDPYFNDNADMMSATQ